MLEEPPFTLTWHLGHRQIPSGGREISKRDAHGCPFGNIVIGAFAVP
jgi:hypothetical protein